MSTKKKTKKRMGRPPLGPKAKSKIVQLRVTPAEFRTLGADAKKAGGTIGDLLMKPWREKENG